MSRKLNAWFQCFAGCDERYELDEIIYQCRRCGSLLEVRHDTDALAATSAAEWKALFAERWGGVSGPFASGVWGKKEWVCPRVDEANIVSLAEVKTPLLRIEAFGRRIGVPDVHVKLCGNSHTGSFKDLGLTVLVSLVNQMRAEGKRVPAVACASTGDTSAALAAYCARAGIQSIVFLPHEKITPSQLVQPVANGALTLAIDTDFDGCMKLVREVCARNNIYLANSMNSLRIEGQKTVSVEICQQLGWQVPDWVVIPGARANPLYLSFLKDFEKFEPQTARKTVASAIQIGNPVSIYKAIRTLKTFGGVVEQAEEEELADACAQADRSGLFSDPHTGVALAALIKLAERGQIGASDRVVVISTAHGLKFPQFKIDYHWSRMQGVESRFANPPVEVADDYDAIVRAIFDRIDGAG